jgi:hypothetical protein
MKKLTNDELLKKINESTDVNELAELEQEWLDRMIVEDAPLLDQDEMEEEILKYWAFRGDR